MTKEELKALGLTDEQAEAVVADYGKNYVSKPQFNAQLQSLKDEKKKVEELTEMQNDLKTKLEGFTSAGATSGADIDKLQKDLKKLQEQYENAEKARQEELNKRVQSEITTQVVDALSKHNAVDPNTLAQLIIPKVTVGEDGAYSIQMIRVMHILSLMVLNHGLMAMRGPLKARKKQVVVTIEEIMTVANL